MLVVLAWPLVLQNWIALDASQKSWILAFLHLTMCLEIAQITSEVSLDIVQIEDRGKIVRVYKREGEFWKKSIDELGELWQIKSKQKMNKTRWRFDLAQKFKWYTFTVVENHQKCLMANFFNIWILAPKMANISFADFLICWINFLFWFWGN